VDASAVGNATRYMNHTHGAVANVCARIVNDRGTRRAQPSVAQSWPRPPCCFSYGESLMNYTGGVNMN
jgi:hypothetical protein